MIACQYVSLFVCFLVSMLFLLLFFPYGHVFLVYIFSIFFWLECLLVMCVLVCMFSCLLYVSVSTFSCEYVSG